MLGERRVDQVGIVGRFWLSTQTFRTGPFAHPRGADGCELSSASRRPRRRVACPSRRSRPRTSAGGGHVPHAGAPCRPSSPTEHADQRSGSPSSCREAMLTMLALLGRACGSDSARSAETLPTEREHVRKMRFRSAIVLPPPHSTRGLDRQAHRRRAVAGGQVKVSSRSRSRTGRCGPGENLGQRPDRRS